MILHRTSGTKKRKSQTFLANSNQQSALNHALQVKDWIDEIFTRTVPIPANYESRFGPAGYNRIPFYCSEKRETTFYEYGYSLLRFQSVRDLGVSAVCFEVVFQGKHRPVDASVVKNFKKILDLKDYSEAQSWLKSLTPEPESVRYPSVRDPNGGGINFAVFERSAIGSSSTAPEDFIFTPKGNGIVEVESLIKGKLGNLKPNC